MNVIDEVNRSLKFRSKVFESEDSQASEKNYHSFISSIVIDYLRARNYNFSYNIFMRESNTVSEELILRNTLAETIGVGLEYGKFDGNQISVL